MNVTSCDVLASCRQAKGLAAILSFRFLALGFIVLAVIVGILPLMLLAPKLSKVRKTGLLEYGKLAQSYTFYPSETPFHQRHAFLRVIWTA